MERTETGLVRQETERVVFDIDPNPRRMGVYEEVRFKPSP